MPHDVHISINETCHERWDSFKKHMDTGFCERCQKSVIDFTNKSEKDIYSFFINNNSSVCGRFKPEQLKTYTSPYHTITHNKLAIFSLSVLALFTGQNAYTQSKSTNSKSDISIIEHKSSTKKVTANSPESKSSKTVLKGRITSIENGTPMPGTLIVVKGSEFGTISDKDGFFELDYHGKKGELITLVFSFIGYSTQEHEIVLREDDISLGELGMSENLTYLGEVCTTKRWSPRSIWWKIKNFFR